MNMYSLVALSVFIVGFITSSFAVCPENHVVRAKECVAVFTRFGKASHQGPGEISQICSEVYGALDCLREIMNNCEEYKNMGLQLSPEDYEKTKSNLDTVCAGDKPTNDVARDISKRGDDTDLIQSNTFSVRATEKQCNQMSESCLTIVDSLGDAGGQREVMCNGMRSMLTCLQNVLDLCADHLDNYNTDTMMAGYQQHLGLYCGPGPMPGGPGPMTGGLEPMPGGLGPMPGGSGPKQVLYQCENKFNECGYIGAQLESPGAQDPVARCVVVRQHAECNDQLLADCGALMPERIRQRLAAAGEQYNQICNLDSNEMDSTQSNTLSARATEKECQTMSESCLTIVDSIGDASGQREVMCNGMRSMLTCLQNVLTECADHLDDYNIDTLMAGYQQHLGMYCGSGPMPSGSGPMPGGPGGPGSLPGGPGGPLSLPGGQGPKQVLSNCENKFNECGQYGDQLDTSGSQDPVARCVVMRQHAECNDQLLGGCGALMPEYMKQSLAAAGQQYKAICPTSNEAVVPKKKPGRLPPAKCDARISKCKSKLVGYEAGNKEKCLQGYKTMICYRRVAKVCKLARPIRKEIKTFKKAHINTCGRKKPRDVDDLDDLDDSLDVYIAWLDGDNIDDD